MKRDRRCQRNKGRRVEHRSCLSQLVSFSSPQEFQELNRNTGIVHSPHRDRRHEKQREPVSIADTRAFDQLIILIFIECQRAREKKIRRESRFVLLSSMDESMILLVCSSQTLRKERISTTIPIVSQQLIL